jgi:hypothetical protein
MTTQQLSPKMQNYREACSHGPEAAFVANVILTSQRNPGRKLAGLVKLLRAGSSVRTGQFAIDVLVIDGRRASWTELES